jgi:hypothetical protein
MLFDLPRLTPPLIPVLIGCVLYWIIRRRLRRNVERQKLRPLRKIISIVLLSAISLALLIASQFLPKLLSGIGAGLVCGALLGFISLWLTKFETTPEGRFYTPDTRIGLALTLLFAGRLAYRFWALNHLADSSPVPPAFKSALTYLTFGLLAGHSIVYSIGLIGRCRIKEKPEKTLHPATEN